MLNTFRRERTAPPAEPPASVDRPALAKLREVRAEIVKLDEAETAALRRLAELNPPYYRRQNLELRLHTLRADSSRGIVEGLREVKNIEGEIAAIDRDHAAELAEIEQIEQQRSERADRRHVLNDRESARAREALDELTHEAAAELAAIESEHKRIAEQVKPAQDERTSLRTEIIGAEAEAAAKKKWVRPQTVLFEQR